MIVRRVITCSALIVFPIMVVGTMVMRMVGKERCMMEPRRSIGVGCV